MVMALPMNVEVVPDDHGIDLDGSRDHRQVVVQLFLTAERVRLLRRLRRCARRRHPGVERAQFQVAQDPRLLHCG